VLATRRPPTCQSWSGTTSPAAFRGDLVTPFPDLERQLGRAAEQLPAQPRAGSARRRAGTGGRPAWGRRFAARRLAPALAGSMLVGALVLALLLAGGGSRDLAARAYAATSGAGIVHWRTDMTGYANGTLGSRQRVEGWALGSVTHILRFNVIHGNAHVTDDERNVGGRYRAWLSVCDDFVSGTWPSRPQLIEMVPSSDSIRRVPPRLPRRKAARSRWRALRGALPPPPGRHRRLHGGPEDRAPAAPRHQERSARDAGRPATRSMTVVRFSAYEKLPPTASNRSRLARLPHPGAGPGKEQASELLRRAAHRCRAHRHTRAPAPDDGPQPRSLPHRRLRHPRAGQGRVADARTGLRLRGDLPRPWTGRGVAGRYRRPGRGVPHGAQGGAQRHLDRNPEPDDHRRA